MYEHAPTTNHLNRLVHCLSSWEWGCSISRGCDIIIPNGPKYKEMLSNRAIVGFTVRGPQKREVRKMALIDVIKFEAEDDLTFAWKYPSDQIPLGSQLVVNEGQQAIFVKGGQALDSFDPGTHTLISGNIPLVDKLINLPFGGNTPFTSEVWFVNTTAKRDLKWGTPNSIPLMDATLGFPVSVRAFGRWGARIYDARLFTTQLVGSQPGSSAETLHEYFIGRVIQSFTQYLSAIIATGRASVLQVSALVSELSVEASKSNSEELQKYGVELLNFDIESINIPREALKQIQEVYAKTREAGELSKVEVGGAFTAIKSFEVLNNAATNESDNSVGALLGAGIGLGAGLPIGSKMGQKMGIEEAPASRETESPADKLRHLKGLLDEGLITEDQFETKRAQILEDI